MFEELKETISTGWRENIGIVSHQVEYVNKEVTFIKKETNFGVEKYSKWNQEKKKSSLSSSTADLTWQKKNPQTLKICLLRYLG